MKLLPRLIVAWRRHWSGGVGVAALWLSCVAALEVYGRRVASDLGDALAVAAVAMVLTITLLRHQRSPMQWLQRVEQSIRSGMRSLSRFWVEIGIDLREEPPLRRGFPSLFTTLAVLLLGVAGVLALLHGLLPSGLREAIVTVAYTPYVVLLAALWAVLVTLSLLLLVIPAAILHDELVFRRASRGATLSRRTVLIAMGAYLLALGCAVYLLPTWFPLAAVAALSVGVLASLVCPPGPALLMLWRAPEVRGVGGLRTFDWRLLISAETAIIAFSIYGIVFLTRGELVFAGGGEVASAAMPVTTALGFAFSWAGAVAMSGWAFIMIRFAVLGRFRNPAKAAPLALHVGGEESAEAHARVARLAEERGWNVRFGGGGPRPGEVPIVVDASSDPTCGPTRDTSGMMPVWPLPVRPAEIAGEDIVRRLERRDEIVRRRQLFRGLERLFKQAAARHFERGEGFWLGLQHWFILGLTRDTPEEDNGDEDATWFEDIIGTPYHKLFRREVRAHFHRVMEALEIDLIFVEDGVGYRKLRGVLRTAFELYDIHGGQQRAEDKHFVGIPGVRVTVHEFILDEPFRSDTYPEPDYEDIGRARIVHVYRDRGGELDPIEAPSDSTFKPVLAGV